MLLTGDIELLETLDQVSLILLLQIIKGDSINLISTKYWLYIFTTLALLGISWYALNTWHYKPLQDMGTTIQRQAVELSSKDIIINDLGVTIQVLKEKNKVVGFEEYYKGYVDENISTVTNDRFIF